MTAAKYKEWYNSHGTTDAGYVRNILPNHYTCIPNANGGISCWSTIGIDDTDEEHWGYVMEAIKQKFGSRFLEVYHLTNYNHKDFIVYLKV